MESVQDMNLALLQRRLRLSLGKRLPLSRCSAVGRKEKKDVEVLRFCAVQYFSLKFQSKNELTLI